MIRQHYVKTRGFFLLIAFAIIALPSMASGVSLAQGILEPTAFVYFPRIVKSYPISYTPTPAITSTPPASTPTPIVTPTPNVPPDMVLIPAGDFYMGCTFYNSPNQKKPSYICISDETPAHWVYLDTFSIDKYEVTNEQFAQCVTAGACSIPSSNSSSTRTSYYDNPAYAKYPVINVYWWDAEDYCTWASKRLPTEAEWEKAARGSGSAHDFKYPWGLQYPDCTLANFRGCIGDTTQVGNYPSGASPYGVLDMLGNVSEWVNDWYSSTYYAVSPPSNPPGPASGSSKMVRGGSWQTYDNYLYLTLRGKTNYGFAGNSIGFRCAATP